MKRFFEKYVKQFIFIIIAIVSVALVAAAISLLFQYSDQVAEQSIAKASYNTLLAKREIEDTMKDYETKAIVVADHVADCRSQLEIYQYLSLLSKKYGYSDILLVRYYKDGVIYSYTGDKYDGELLDSQKNGHGKFTFVGGNTYEGGFENDAKSGYGIFIWADGSRYEGYFRDDVKCGYGSMTFVNGDQYEGNFYDDMRSGTGLYTWKDGTSYSGTFRKNLMDTRLVDAEGNFVVDENGSYKHGEMAYYTTITETGKKTYTGYFQEGKIVPVK